MEPPKKPTGDTHIRKAVPKSGDTRITKPAAPKPAAPGGDTRIRKAVPPSGDTRNLPKSETRIVKAVRPASGILKSGAPAKKSGGTRVVPAVPSGGGLKTWWRRRGRWTRIALIALAVPVLYVVVRSAMFAVAASTPITDVVPDTAHVYVRLPRFSAFLADLESQPAWTAMTDRVLTQRVLREYLNARLAAYGAPTLDQLEDERYLATEGRMLRRSTLESFAGRDAVVAMRVDGESWQVVAVSRMAWWQYLISPVASFFAPDEISFHGAYAVWGAQTALAQDIGSRPYAPAIEGGDHPTIELRFPEGAEGRRWRETLQGFPAGILTYMIDWSATRGFAAELRVQGGEIMADCRVVGGRVANRAASTVNVASAAPSSAFLLMPSQCGAAPVWSWAVRFADLPPPSTAFMATMHDIVRNGVARAREVGFEQRVLPLLDGPTMVLLGMSESARGGRPRPVTGFAVVLGSSRPAETYDQFTAVFDEIAAIERLEDYGELVEERMGVGRLRYLRQRSDAMAGFDYLISPAYAEIPEGIVIGSHPDLVRAVHGGWMPREPFRESSAWTAHSAALARVGMTDAIEPTNAGGLIVHLPTIPDGMEPFFEVFANQEERDQAVQVRVEQELEQEARQRGMNEDEARQYAQQHREERVVQNVRRRVEMFREEFAYFSEFGIMAMRLREEGGDLRARIVVTVGN